MAEVKNSQLTAHNDTDMAKDQTKVLQRTLNLSLIHI